MISNLNDINRILLSVRQLSSRRFRVPMHMLIEHMKGEVLLGKNPEFEPILEFVRQLGLTSHTRTGIYLTDLGEEMVNHNSSEMYELEPDQCRLLLRTCYLDGALRSEMRQFIRKFSTEANGAIVWSSIDSEPLGKLEWLGNHLLQLGLLEVRKSTLEVQNNYRDTILHFLDEGSDFTEEQFEQYLREKRLVGSIAEAYVLEFEKKRLREHGHKVESACVQRLNKRRVNAGYDITSFDGGSTSLQPNRFIEVKGSGQTAVRFIWTENEMEKAKKLGNQYWIYFVGGVDRKNKVVTRLPIMIQNPQSYLNSDSTYRISAPGSVLVEGSISAPPLVTPYRVYKTK